MAPKRRKSLEDFNGPFNRRIAARMRELGMRKLEEFADYSGIGATTVYGLVQGRVSQYGNWIKPSIDTLVKLSEALDVPLHELVYEIEPDAPGASLASNFAQQPPVRRLRILTAGWCGAGPDQEEEVLDEQVWIDENFARGKDLVAFKIRGDSMQAGKHPIYDGDTVLVDRKDKGYNTATVVARLVDNGYVCKVLKDDRFGRFLQSRNVDHTNGTPSAIPMEQVEEIVGRVVRIIHDDKPPADEHQLPHHSQAA
jgi:repressor LexA